MIIIRNQQEPEDNTYGAKKKNLYFSSQTKVSNWKNYTPEKQDKKIILK